ncbi:MAG: hypothetical protein HFG27_08330 [Provencibacterium sp.]|nr:hypothetical protein [Provencibacterium sp.]
MKKNIKKHPKLTFSIHKWHYFFTKICSKLSSQIGYTLKITLYFIVFIFTFIALIHTLLNLWSYFNHSNSSTFQITQEILFFIGYGDAPEWNVFINIILGIISIIALAVFTSFMTVNIFNHSSNVLLSNKIPICKYDKKNKNVPYMASLYIGNRGVDIYDISVTFLYYNKDQSAVDISNNCYNWPLLKKNDVWRIDLPIASGSFMLDYLTEDFTATWPLIEIMEPPTAEPVISLVYNQELHRMSKNIEQQGENTEECYKMLCEMAEIIDKKQTIPYIYVIMKFIDSTNGQETIKCNRYSPSDFIPTSEIERVWKSNSIIHTLKKDTIWKHMEYVHLDNTLQVEIINWIQQGIFSFNIDDFKPCPSIAVISKMKVLQRLNSDKQIEFNYALCASIDFSKADSISDPFGMLFYSFESPVDWQYYYLHDFYFDFRLKFRSNFQRMFLEIKTKEKSIKKEILKENSPSYSFPLKTFFRDKTDATEIREICFTVFRSDCKKNSVCFEISDVFLRKHLSLNT